MNNKTTILALFGLIAILLAGCAQQNEPPATGTNAPPANNPVNPTATLSATINITPTGYSPQSVTIKKGGTVTWINDTDTPNWPATAQHPTHEKYPDSSISKCGTAEQSTIFDACKGLAKGETFTFTFNNIGEWSYHEHLAVKMFGKINVVE